MAGLYSQAACGDDPITDPIDVVFGTTAIVVVVNPTVNDANVKTLPVTGTTVSGVILTTDDGVRATTGPDGVAVLAPVTPGTRSVTLSGAIDGGTFTVMIADGALHEVALAADAGRAQVMVDIDYHTEDAFEVTAEMTNAQVNSALASSNRVVFFRGGHYTGDLDFSGSSVTLFGEGVLGGGVVLDGNVVMTGSDSRIRGAEITGSLDLQASSAGLSFSRVNGALTSDGSDGMFLANELCGGQTVTGSGTAMLGNLGAAPLGVCP